ncbi:LacI family DNA-binding transcriptional regulator [Streptomyces sp. NPDC126933]|uniref:LacI family DNA-binding transcriptional regulator n=1 Tax=unclassified Streptomyces TaxID=2593676 RepID=UPI0036524A2B
MQVRRPTLEAVAARAGVGRGTASRVVNATGNVSQKSRRAVLRAVAELGYVPNPAARALVRRRTDTLAFVVAVSQERVFWEEPYFSAIVRGVHTGISGTGLQLLLAIAHSPQEHAQLTNYLTARHVDGVLLSSLRGDDPMPRHLHEAGLPTVMVGAPTGFHPEYGVDLDNHQGARLAVHHLTSRGRRRIATITGPLDTRAGTDRLEGWRTALTDTGLRTDLTAHGDFTAASGAHAMRELLTRAPELDAVFTASDSMAIGALRVLKESGRRIPHDVAVIGFDDSPLATDTDPPLTSIHQPLENMGHHMAHLMIAQLRQEPITQPHITLQPHLVTRHSA